MVDYKLSKELKEAGYPQEGDGYAVFESGGKPMKAHLIGVPDVVAYAPTLSELIDSCGENFQQLYKKHGDYVASTEELGHSAEQRNNPSLGYTWIEGYGKSPKEAVAKLWLELNRI